jgi:carbon storage regulator
MLVLRRKANESIVIGSTISLRVLAVKGKTVQLGIEAPTEVPIRRAELSILTLPSAGMSSDQGGMRQ